jgi:hypothetical protein
METIANGPLSQLLALMMVPLIAGLLLAAFLVFSFAQRRKKSQMKHGYHPSKPTDVVESESATEPETPNATEEAIEIDINVLSNALNLPPQTLAENSTPGLEDRLNLGILGRGLDVAMNTPQNSAPESLPVQETSHLNAPARPVESAQAVPPARLPELLRLLRDPQSGQLVVEVNGQQYTKLADISDKKVGQYILKLTAHLLAFTNGVIVTEAGTKSVYKPKLGPAPEPIVAASSGGVIQPKPSEPPVPVPSPPPEATFLAPLPGAPLPQPPAPQPRGLFSRVMQPAPPPVNLPGLNLAAEINEIVQARLRHSPLAENNRVEISSDLGGGIRINVNGRIYSSPDEVPDQQIKELIQASIREWERS